MEGLLKRVNESKKISLLMKIYCRFIEIFGAFEFLLLLVFFARKSLLIGASYLLALGVPYLLVSLVRVAISAPRPYEIYDFYIIPPRKKKGKSFPSRHAFSVFVIGTVCLFVYPILGILTLIFGALMCLCRVLLGIHFPRDVIAGGVVGVISALIGALILL